MLTHRFDKGMGGWNVMRELGLLELQPLDLDHWTRITKPTSVLKVCYR